jgi:hypothetical protein
MHYSSTPTSLLLGMLLQTQYLHLNQFYCNRSRANRIVSVCAPCRALLADGTATSVRCAAYDPSTRRRRGAFGSWLARGCSSRGHLEGTRSVMAETPARAPAAPPPRRSDGPYAPPWP